MKSSGLVAAILHFACGFFGAFVASILLGLLVLGVANAVAPEWVTAWSIASTAQKILWVGLPTLIVLVAVVLTLWRRQRAAAIGVIAFAVADAFLR